MPSVVRGRYFLRRRVFTGNLLMAGALSVELGGHCYRELFRGTNAQRCDGMLPSAMLADQTFEGRRENLSQANKLSRSHAVLLEALNRHRGKGQQKVTVEHVHVHSGGQAIVGMVEGPALDNSSKPERQPNAKQIAHAPQPAMRGPNPEREVVPSASDAERPLPDARRNVTRSTEGK